MPQRRYLVLDIETVADDRLYTLPPPDENGKSEFPPLYACKVVVLGVMLFEPGGACERIGIVGQGKSEREILSDFSTFVEKQKPHLVSWNGRGFDLPVIALRSMHHGVPMPWYYQDRDYRYRFSTSGHLDLCDHLSDHRAAKLTSLAGAAQLVGLPGKDGVDGSQVQSLFEAGEIEALNRYCLSDVAQTSFVFFRQRLLSGEMDLPTYQSACQGLLDDMEKDGRFAALLEKIDRPQLLLAEG